MRQLRAVTFLVSLCVALAGGVEIAGAAEGIRKTETIQLRKYMGVLRTIDVTVGGETVPFIFDTAGGLTIVTPGLAHRHNCQEYGRIVGFRMSGEQLALPRCGEMQIGIGQNQHEVETVVLDVMALLPEGWPEIGGIVSLHTFEDVAITIELGVDQITVETDESLVQRTAAMKALNSRFNSQTGGEGRDLFVEATARDGSLWLEVDSGNMGPVILAPHAFDQLGETHPGADGGELELVLVGLEPMTVAVTEKPIIYDGVVSARVLETLVLTVDTRTGQSWAVPVQKTDADAETG